MINKHIKFPFQGRYYSIGSSVGATSRDVWFVLHGQGQLAKYFLKKFEVIANNERKIIAPEGLSRYYLEGFKGRVGATWMTKEDRLSDISNYLEFLNTVYAKEITDQRDVRVTILGFSQGAATASRWVLEESIFFDRLILWSGLFPPDLDFEKGNAKLKDREILSIYGKDDPYLTDEKISEQYQLANRLGVSISTIEFNGGHVIDTDTLLTLI